MTCVLILYINIPNLNWIDASEKHKKYMFSKCLLRHDVVRVFVSFLVLVFVRAIVMVPLNMTYLHCLQHSLFEHLFNLYFKSYWADTKFWLRTDGRTGVTLNAPPPFFEWRGHKNGLTKYDDIILLTWLIKLKMSGLECVRVVHVLF